MAVNVKLGVDLGGFNSGINAAKAEVKTLDQQMKMIDATFKATGNAEQAMSQKTQTLNKQMDAQKRIATQAEQALKAMTNAGVDPASASYQRMAQELLKAQTGMMNTQVALNGLGDSAQEAASGADQLTNSVNGISKKISLDQVIGGIDTIKSGLESAAKKAVQLGEAIWNNVMDSARLSDDILTQAGILDMTPEQYQRYKGVFNTIGEVTITEWAATKRKIEKAMVDPSSDQMDVFRMLGLTGMGGKEENTEILNIADNWEDVFWQVGSELQKRVESGEMSSAMSDVYGEALFGKKYSSMKNLLKLGQEGFKAALNEQNIISDEALEKDAALNDAVIKLQDSFNALKAEVTSGLAPALTDAANALDGVLGKILEYLQTEEGKKLLEDLGTAVSGLFDDLGKIDPEQVVSGFTGVITTVTDGIKWLVDNAETVKGILEVIVGAWALSNVAIAGLEITKLVQGIKGLTATEAAAAGASAGTSWAGAFAKAAMKAAPFLAFLYTMLNPSDTHDEIGNNTLVDENGNLTTEGQQYGYYLNENGEVAQDRRAIMEQVAQEAWDLYRAGKFDKEANDYVQGMLGIDEMKALYRQMYGITGKEGWKNIEDLDLTDWLNEFEPVPVEVDPEAPANAAEQIAGQVGPVVLPVGFQIRSDYANLQGYILKQLTGHANGLSYVPNEGLYHLHRGEQVVPAREVASRSFSSNLYVENMNMGGSMSADALAAAIAGRNRRLMTGYGS